MSDLAALCRRLTDGGTGPTQVIEDYLAERGLASPGLHPNALATFRQLLDLDRLEAPARQRLACALAELGLDAWEAANEDDPVPRQLVGLHRTLSGEALVEALAELQHAETRHPAAPRLRAAEISAAALPQIAWVSAQAQAAARGPLWSDAARTAWVACWVEALALLAREIEATLSG